LVVDLKVVDDEEEARRRGFPNGKAFKLLQYDFILVPSGEAEAARQKFVAGGGQDLGRAVNACRK